MSFTRRLLLSELHAQVALIICTVVVPAGLVAWSYLSPEKLGWSPSADDAYFPLGLSAFTYLYGLLPVALYGAPLYAIASHLGRSTWAVVVAIGLLPGAILLLLTVAPSLKNSDINPASATIVLGCGLLVSSLTHAMHRRSRSTTGGV